MMQRNPKQEELRQKSLSVAKARAHTENHRRAKLAAKAGCHPSEIQLKEAAARKARLAPKPAKPAAPAAKA